MKTILVLAAHPEVADAVRAAVDPDQVRVIHRVDAEEAEPLLNPSLIDVCVIDADQAHVQGIWAIEKVTRRAPECPILVFASDRHWEWEEEAYIHGVRHVLVKPVRPRVLNALLGRLWAAPQTPVASPGSTPPAPVALPTEPWAGAFLPTPNPLNTLRDLSGILTHSLCAEALLRQFLLQLREILGVNRSAIFLRLPGTVFADRRSGDDSRLLRSACAIGLPQGLLDHFKLSLESGIGAYVFRHGRILRRDSREVQADPALQKEFEILGVQVAIPVPDRETLVGIAVFDGRVTGQPLANAELELVFHLLEALGLAVKNIWLHDQLAANSEMMTDVLRQLSSGCVVVGRDLGILHANKAARHCFARTGRRHAEFDFSDLPPVLASKVYQVLKTGAGIAPFKYRPNDSPQTVFQVSVLPVQSQPGGLPESALLIVEDHTQSEQLHQLELETANLRLVRQMADRLAHEVGNAMVPLSTHQQLFARKYDDREFRASLDASLAEGVRRVTRLVNQMRFLARDQLATRERVPIPALIEEAYQEAQKYQPVKGAQLKYVTGKEPIVVEGDRAALKHAIAEIMLNALQANPQNARITVEFHRDTDRNGIDWLHLEFRDNGTGFTPEAARRAPEPFFTTRNVGLGLGLVVSRKVAETHAGRVEIVNPQKDAAGIVRLSLPVTQPPESPA
jgi:signal transduction histidine kinase/CheY-like chemotaxis protein